MDLTLLECILGGFLSKTKKEICEHEADLDRFRRQVTVFLGKHGLYHTYGDQSRNKTRLVVTWCSKPFMTANQKKNWYKKDFGLI